MPSQRKKKIATPTRWHDLKVTCHREVFLTTELRNRRQQHSNEEGPGVLHVPDQNQGPS